MRRSATARAGAARRSDASSEPATPFALVSSELSTRLKSEERSAA